MSTSSAEANGRGALGGLGSFAYTLRPEFAGRTHVGLRRHRNEDNLLLMPGRRLAVVADGMGGRPCGDLASELAASTVGEFFLDVVGTDAIRPYAADVSRTDDENHLAAALRFANRRIHDRSVELTGREGNMGTTAVAALFSEDGQTVSVAHVGDSRCYRIRDGEIVQLTRDHSLASEVAQRAPWLSAEALRQVPKNVLSRALGLKPDVLVDVYSEETRAGDIYLLCSDGLWGRADPEEILAIVETSVSVRGASPPRPPPETRLMELRSSVETSPPAFPEERSSMSLDDACARLIDLANGLGGIDNTTVVLARVARVESPRRSGLALRAIRDESTYDSEPDLEWDR